jgi:hypothetical protein
MDLRQKIEHLVVEELDSKIVFFDGFDDALIGFENGEFCRAIYSVKECIKILCRDMNEDDAIEHFEFNVRGTKLYSQTPIFCEDYFE